MRRIALILSLAAFATTLAGRAAPAAQTAAKTSDVVVFTHATVIDMKGATPLRDTTVVVTGGKIARVGPSEKAQLPEGARVVDATGKFLIPGLWDMHVHWYDERSLGLFTANGVTGVRVMFGSPMHLDWRKRVAEGSLVGPRMVVGSPIVDGPKPVWPGSTIVADAAQGRSVVDALAGAGFDFVKVYSMLPRDGYLGIAEEAKKKGVVFAGHVPNSVGAAEASDVGQKSIEHLTGVLLACSSKEDELRAALVAAATGDDDAVARAGAVGRSQAATVLETFDRDKEHALLAKFVKNGTWQCPTLVVLRNVANLDDPSLAKDPRMKYMPAMLRASWDPTKDFRFKARTPEDWAAAKRTLAKQIEVVGDMRRAGVKLIAGTDCLNPYCFPGFSLHDELALLVEAGLTPMEALRAATSAAAEFRGASATEGTIEEGKVADLVLLDADPLADIHNTTKIAVVVQGGRLFDRAALDALLAKAEALAGA